MRENGAEPTPNRREGDSLLSPGASGLRRGDGNGALDRRASAVTAKKQTRAPRLAARNLDPPHRSEVRPLTHREKEILRFLSEGVSTAAIAERLFISRVTVRNHVQHILHKLGVHSKLAAVAQARRQKLL